MHGLRLDLPRVALGETIRLSERAPVDVSQATAHIQADGTFNNETVDLPVAIKLRDMQANARAGRRPLGLEPDAAGKIFQRISELTLVAILEGPLEAPRVRVDARQTLEGLRGSLVAVGAGELSSLAGKHLEKLTAELPIKLPTDKAGIKPDALLEGLGGLLGGKKDDSDDQKKEEEDPQAESKPAGILDRLLK